MYVVKMYLPVTDRTNCESNDLFLAFFLPLAHDWDSSLTPSTATRIFRSAAFHPKALLDKMMLMAAIFSLVIPGTSELKVVSSLDVADDPSKRAIRSSNDDNFLSIVSSR